MAENSLFPCSCEILYRTINAPHRMILPLTEWSPISTGHPSGTNLAWDTTQVDTDDMISGLKDLLLPFWPPSTTFSSYTISTYANKDAPARPQASFGFVVGAGTGAATIPAAQATFNFKTTNFGAFKLVMLDAKVSAAFGPLDSLVVGVNDDEIALRDWLRLEANAFSGRDGFRPSVLPRITYTLNEKLRASYHLD